jgi:DNA (cytosine-5)-methyltransferase 1
MKRPVAELFAGVGGFRVGLERTQRWEVIWSNQWEPGTRLQHASECYEKHFQDGIHVNEDIAEVLDLARRGRLKPKIPPVDLVVGGFPCQDYSVAKPLPQADGIVGRKGVLWWEIRRFIIHKGRPKYLFLENVDRLLKSPATRRGRDFAVMLACLADLGYLVEWRVVNAADYGFPQKRRRVFIVARRLSLHKPPSEPTMYLLRDGVFAKSLPVLAAERGADLPRVEVVAVGNDPYETSESFGLAGGGRSPFKKAGVMWNGVALTVDIDAAKEGHPKLRDVLEPDLLVPAQYWIDDENDLARWKYLKGAKSEERVRPDGGVYRYEEGRIPFPDDIDGPARTILTAEGGSTPTRFKHIIRTDSGRWRRLTPIELERLNGFEDGWTDTGMPDSRRAFMMGNAVVVGVVERIGRTFADFADAWELRSR